MGSQKWDNGHPRQYYHLYVSSAAATATAAAAAAGPQSLLPPQSDFHHQISSLANLDKMSCTNAVAQHCRGRDASRERGRGRSRSRSRSDSSIDTASPSPSLSGAHGNGGKDGGSGGRRAVDAGLGLGRGSSRGRRGYFDEGRKKQERHHHEDDNMVEDDDDDDNDNNSFDNDENNFDDTNALEDNSDVESDHELRYDKKKATRSSIMDNMLLSLDRIQIAPHSHQDWDRQNSNAGIISAYNPAAVAAATATATAGPPPPITTVATTASIVTASIASPSISAAHYNNSGDDYQQQQQQQQQSLGFPRCHGRTRSYSAGNDWNGGSNIPTSNARRTQVCFNHDIPRVSHSRDCDYPPTTPVNLPSPHRRPTPFPFGMIDSAPNPTISPKVTGDHADKSEGSSSSWLGRGLVRRMSMRSMQNGGNINSKNNKNIGGNSNNNNNSSSNSSSSNNKNNSNNSNSNKNDNQDLAGNGLLGDPLSAKLAAVRSSSWRSKQELNQNNRRLGGDGRLPPSLNLQPVPQYVEDAAPSPAISFNKDFECEIPYGQDFFTLPCSPGSSGSASMGYDFEMRSPTSPRSPRRDFSDSYGPTSMTATCNPVSIGEPRVKKASKTLQSTLGSDGDGSKQLGHNSTRNGLDARSDIVYKQPQQHQQHQKQHQPQQTHQQKQPLQKEKSGFLRKFFSSGNKGTTTTVDTPAQSSRSTPWSPAGNVVSPTRNNVERHGESKTIGKKPSGFFKKRKKSIPTSPVPQNPIMSNWNASINPDILHAPDRQPDTASGYPHPSQTNSATQRKHSQGTGIPTRASIRDDAGSVSEPAPSEGDPLGLTQAHGQLTPSSPVDVSSMTKAEDFMAQILERPTDSSTSFEKSMQHYLGGSAAAAAAAGGSNTNSMTEEMTRMRSLTTGSEGDLNPAALDKSKEEHETTEKDRFRDSTLITIPSRPVVERRWTDQQQQQQHHHHHHEIEEALPRSTSHSQIQRSSTVDTPSKLASAGTTPATSSMTDTPTSSKATSPNPAAEKAKSAPSVKSHRTHLGGYAASSRTGSAEHTGVEIPDDRAGKPQVWLNPSLNSALSVEGVSPRDVDSSYKANNNNSANFKFEVSIDNVDEEQLHNSCQQCLGSDKQAIFLDTEAGQRGCPEHSEQKRLGSSDSYSSPQDSPTVDDSEVARQLFETDDPTTISVITNGRPVVAWLGSPDRANVRRMYIQHFNWTNLNIVNALRSLCSRIPLKGEGQQVDRVLESFSARWCECNPNHLFKSIDVVHTISYSLLLLNTDLHFAENETKMTRGQFVRNTMPIIQRQIVDQSTLELGGRSRVSSAPDSPSSSSNQTPNYTQGRPPFGRSETDSDYGHSGPNTPSTIDAPGSQQALTVPGSHTHHQRERASANKAWDTQIESVLKEFYNMIQKQQLPLKGIEIARQGSQSEAPNSLFGGLRRTPSVVGKSGADGLARSSRAGENVFTRAASANKWVGKARSRPRLYPPVSMNNRVSLEDHSQWSPAYSSAARGSKHSLGKMTLSSPSMESVDSAYPMSAMGAEYQQTVGFANALGHAIAKDDKLESPDVDDGELSVYDGASGILDDESLELCGAPWIKEGNVKHKHDLDDTGKRSKDRNWTQCFAVVQRGWLRLFSFDSSNTVASKLRSRNDKHGKSKESGRPVVGGGNWLESAEEITAIRLRQTVATAFPTAGYSRSRPHVWALTLPSGAIHLFQVGTDTIVNEFVFTANYWSARLSKEPLTGGISNMEYGWSENVLKHVYEDQQQQQQQTQQHQQSSMPPRANSAGAGVPNTRQKTGSGGRPSFHSSMRGSFDGSTTNQCPVQLGDKVHIAEWVPPQQSMITSGLGEQEQLRVIQNYLTAVIEDLRRHTDIRTPLTQAFAPRSTQYNKAMNNWERKHNYLLSEHRKCKTYICALVDAQEARKRVYQERDDYKKAMGRPISSDGQKATSG